jgi:hypothetical protein
VRFADLPARADRFVYEPEPTPTCVLKKPAYARSHLGHSLFGHSLFDHSRLGHPT